MSLRKTDYCNTRAHVTLFNMITTVLRKLCLVAAILEVLYGGNSVYGSSIYVGGHEAGTYSEGKPSESIYSEGKEAIRFVHARK